MLRLDPARHPFALLDELFGASRPARRVRRRTAPFEVLARDEGLLLRAALPGLDAEAIDVSLEEDVLHVRAPRRPRVPADAEDARVIASELPDEPVDLAVRLGFRPDPAGIRASYALGVLAIELPRAPEERPHRIPVTTR